MDKRRECCCFKRGLCGQASTRDKRVDGLINELHQARERIINLEIQLSLLQDRVWDQGVGNPRKREPPSSHATSSENSDDAVQTRG